MMNLGAPTMMTWFILRVSDGVSIDYIEVFLAKRSKVLSAAEKSAEPGSTWTPAGQCIELHTICSQALQMHIC